jgi:TPR repeat protein
MYEDGSDGVARDEEKSMQAMARACGLGDAGACEWVLGNRREPISGAKGPSPKNHV